MIGDGWAGEPATRPGEYGDVPQRPRRVAIVTGSRADFGLLEPVIEACRERPLLEPLVIAAGSHLVGPTLTYREVAARFEVIDKVPMQVAGRTGRAADVEALGRGIQRLGRVLEFHQPDWTVVLGDRIEAMAAATAASVGGFALAHIHGGDRAEGVADEAMRHAITKLAHLHLAASEHSAERIRRMGEPPETVHLVGSPALDGLDAIEAMEDEPFEELGSPELLVLMHPIGRTNEAEEAIMSGVLAACAGRRALALMPNFDAGRVGIVRAIEAWGGPHRYHLARPQFIALLKRLARDGGVLVGNSSAALIEASALRLPSADIGPRQGGRETAGNVLHAQSESAEEIRATIERAGGIDRDTIADSFGDGHAGARIASILERVDPGAPGFTRKRCVY